MQNKRQVNCKDVWLLNLFHPEMFFSEAQHKDDCMYLFRSMFPVTQREANNSTYGGIIIAILFANVCEKL